MQEFVSGNFVITCVLPHLYFCFSSSVIQTFAYSTWKSRGAYSFLLLTKHLCEMEEEPWFSGVCKGISVEKLFLTVIWVWSVSSLRRRWLSLPEDPCDKAVRQKQWSSATIVGKSQNAEVLSGFPYSSKQGCYSLTVSNQRPRILVLSYVMKSRNLTGFHSELTLGRVGSSAHNREAAPYCDPLELEFSPS